MELKRKKGLNADALEALAEETLTQIEDKRYDLEMREVIHRYSLGESRNH